MLLIWLMALIWTPAPKPNWPPARECASRPHSPNHAVPLEYG
ncbi:hypothetical protein [Burkholderia cenocepacia]|nr:hypothetical protein [Burkholderia cenocepacia]